MARTLKVGDVLYCSWGYSMSIVDFYIVTELRGNSSVRIAELPKTQIDGETGWTGKVIPDMSCNTPADMGKTYRAGDDVIKISSCQYARKWDGKPVYFCTLD